ncbi:MAG: hypothetical protein QXW98_04320 [Candidatus Caldarchaeum sp.]
MKQLDLNKIKWTGWCIMYDNVPIQDQGTIPIVKEEQVNYDWQVIYFIRPKDGTTKEPCTIIHRDFHVAGFETVTDQTFTYLDIGYKVDDSGNIKAVWFLSSEQHDEIIEDIQTLKERLKNLRLSIVYDPDALMKLAMQLEDVKDRKVVDESGRRKFHRKTGKSK